MTLSPHEFLDRLAFLTGRPIRARHVAFEPRDASVCGRFVDADGDWIAAVWADDAAVLRFSAATAMLPLDAALYSMTTDTYLLDDFRDLVGACAAMFDGDLRLSELSDAVVPPSQIHMPLAMQVWVPDYGAGRIGFGLLEARDAFRRTRSAVTDRRPTLLAS